MGLRLHFSYAFLATMRTVKKIEILFGILRVPLDILGVVAALLLSYNLRQQNIDLVPWIQLIDTAATLPLLADYWTEFVWPAIAFFLFAAAFLGLYALRLHRSGWGQVATLFEAVCLWLVFVMGWFFLVKKELFFSRILLLHSTFFVFLFTAIARGFLLMVQRWFLRMGFGVRIVVSIGHVPVAPTVQRLLERDVHYHYLGHYKRSGEVQQLERKHDIDLVLHTDPHPTDEATQEVIEYCRSEHIEYAFFPPVLTDSPHQLAVEHMGLLPLIRFRPTPLDGWGRVYKRSFDTIMSIVLLALLSPILIFIALCIVLDSGFPVFYVSKRVGLGGRVRIPIIKFRTMCRDADQKKKQLEALNHRKDGPLFKMKDDPRITGVGRILRRWSLDELPNLFNVITGQMSLVGPRPHLPDEVSRYSSYQRRVFAICPGVTGLAQISGRSDLKFEEEVRLDLQYIEEWSPLLDLWILWRTFFVLIGRKGAD